MRRQVSSRVLALMLAGANAVACVGIVAAQYALRPDELPAEVVMVLDAPSVSEYRQVTGAGGMTTHIPAHWPTTAAGGPGATQADDPMGSTRMLRYGGWATPVTDSYPFHVDYERRFARSRTDYVSFRLERTTVRGMPAVDWEFEYDAPTGRRHVRSVYWLAQGHEYFVHASAPVPLWPETREIIGVMLDNSTP
jgi:hypothetical protein